MVRGGLCQGSQQTSRHPGLPHRAAVLSRPMAHLPVPQIVLSPHQLMPTSRSVCVLNLGFGESLLAGLLLECRRTGWGEVLTRLYQTLSLRGRCRCAGSYARPVPLDIACVHTFAWDRPKKLLPGNVQEEPEAAPQEVFSRSTAEVAVQISDPPRFRLTIHLPDVTSPRVEPTALFTQAPTLSSLASEHVSLFRRHHSLRLRLPAFTPVGSGSLPHVFAECD